MGEMTTGKMIRRVSLIILMVSGVAFCVLLWIGYGHQKYMIVPAVGFTGVYVWFIIMEIWGVLFGVKKTLSTRFKHWATEHPVMAWISLGLFLLAMTSLTIHLGVYW